MKIGSNNVYELREIALKLGGQKRYEEAKKYYDKALELEPNNPGSMRMAAINFRYMKRYGDALKLLEKCLIVHPEKHHVWRDMAYIYEKKAEDIYRESVICIVSTPLPIWREWEDIKFYYEMAIKCMEKASIELPSSWGILQELERYHAFIGNYEKAIDYREEAKKVFKRRNYDNNMR